MQAFVCESFHKCAGVISIPQVKHLEVTPQSGIRRTKTVEIIKGSGPLFGDFLLQGMWYVDIRTKDLHFWRLNAWVQETFWNPSQESSMSKAAGTNNVQCLWRIMCRSRNS